MATTGSEQRRLQIMFAILGVLVLVFVVRTFVMGGGGGGGGSDAGSVPAVTTTTIAAVDGVTPPVTADPDDPAATTSSTAPAFGEPNTRNPFEPNYGAVSPPPGDS